MLEIWFHLTDTIIMNSVLHVWSVQMDAVYRKTDVMWHYQVYQLTNKQNFVY